MLAKRVNNRLLCSFSEFEAKLLRQLVGSVSAGGQGYTAAFKALSQMGDCFAENDVYFMDPDPFGGSLKMLQDATNIIHKDIAESGWGTMGEDIE